MVTLLKWSGHIKHYHISVLKSEIRGEKHFHEINKISKQKSGEASSPSVGWLVNSFLPTGWCVEMFPPWPLYIYIPWSWQVNAIPDYQVSYRYDIVLSDWSALLAACGCLHVNGRNWPWQPLKAGPIIHASRLLPPCVVCGLSRALAITQPHQLKIRGCIPIQGRPLPSLFHHPSIRVKFMWVSW